MNKVNVITSFWIICVGVSSLIIFYFLGNSPLNIVTSDWVIFTALLFISAFCEYIDSSLGMGYGTTLTPLMLSFGVLRSDIVPAVLLSELLTGIFSSLAHHREGNIDLFKNKYIRKSLLYLALPSVLGVAAAIFLGDAVKSFGQHYANLYIGVMITSIGIYLVYINLYKKSKKEGISKSGLVSLGIVAAFNKGISGGGYGPLMTGGQVTAGVKEKEAIITTSLCEYFTCTIGLVIFFALGGSLNLFYAIPLCIGSMLTIVPAAKTVKILPNNVLKQAIGWVTLFLGVITLYKFFA